MSELELREGAGESEFDERYQELRELHGAIFREALGEVPRRAALTVDASASVADAVTAMNERHVGCALVVRDGKLAGIFTERDVLRRVVAAGVDVRATAVEKVMTKDPDVLPETASIAYALREMSGRGYRHIPLVDEERRPVGVVAVRDIVRWLVDLFPPAIFDLPEPSVPKAADGA